MNLIGYLRVSSDEQADSGLGIEAQRMVIKTELARRGWTLAYWANDEGYSAKRGAPPRPAYLEARRALAAGEADGLIAARMDRVSRSTVDLGTLLEASVKEKWELTLLDIGVDTTTAAGRMQFRQMAVFAEFERDLISERTKAALAVLKARGVILGAPRRIPAATESLIVGYAATMSYAAIARRLNADRVPSAGGKPWGKSTVASVITRAT